MDISICLLLFFVFEDLELYFFVSYFLGLRTSDLFEEVKGDSYSSNTIGPFLVGVGAWGGGLFLGDRAYGIMRI
jgi:hypothetical protein